MLHRKISADETGMSPRIDASQGPVKNIGKLISCDAGIRPG